LKKTLIACSLSVLLVAVGWTLRASSTNNPGDGRGAKSETLPLDSMVGLEVRSIKEDGTIAEKTKVELVSYRGRRAMRVVNIDSQTGTDPLLGSQTVAIVKASEFKNGTVEADVAAFPRVGADPSTRGFAGIAFRLQDHGSRYEVVYVRMTNGRADDQLRRNHSIQYSSAPDFPWYRLRKETPGVYESYVDLDAGAWTKLKIVVNGLKATAYVNGAEQPCLIVNDLKLGETHGQVALWTGSDTEAYFSNLKISSAE
jgi:hypothetical protein